MSSMVGVVTFPFYSCVWEAHVNADADLPWLFWFSRHHNREHPRSGPADLLYDSLPFQRLQLILDFPSQVERYASVPPRYRLN